MICRELSAPIFTLFLIVLFIPPFILHAEGSRELEHGLPELESEEARRPEKLQQAMAGFQDERTRMVERQLYKRGITDPKVLKAMLAVPRHIFVPQSQRAYAYYDQPLPIGYGQTISQPYIVAYMTQMLRIKPGDVVLEIGTGSGYQAAVLAELTDWIYTIEIIKELHSRTRKLYDLYGYDSIQTRAGDGYYGWEEQAPFDAIIVTAAAGHVPPPLMTQLKPGGRIIIPVGSVYDIQMLLLITKGADGSLSTEQLLPVRFVPMIGTVQQDG